MGRNWIVPRSRKRTGKTFSQLVNEIRIEKSKELLTKNNLSILEIALSVGFNNQNYFSYYTVEKGDSLYAISRRYNINPELLAGLNGLSMEDYIYPNQEILIPKSGFSYYITKEGDTIDLVAGLFKTSAENVLKNNGIIYLDEGQVLVQPK